MPDAGAVALVYGEAGIGKTSLVRAFADDSPGPGDHHGSAILRKPGVTNRAQAATEAIRLGVAAKL